jgi:hypothetical protein
MVIPIIIIKSTQSSVHSHISVIATTDGKRPSGICPRPYPALFAKKKTGFAIIRPSELKTIENLLNNRPSKCLNFKASAEVFSFCGALAG